MAFDSTYRRFEEDIEGPGWRDGVAVGTVDLVFIDEVSMQTIVPKRGVMSLVDGSLSGFLHSIGTPHDKVYDERIMDYLIKIDGPMASVWTPYKFYLGEQFSHCGVNSFQLMKKSEGWKIIYLVDTRRKDNCN